MFAQYYPAIYQDFAGLVRAASFVLIRVCRAWLTCRPRDTSFLRPRFIAEKRGILSLSHHSRNVTMKVVTRQQAADRKFRAEHSRPYWYEPRGTVRCPLQSDAFSSIPAYTYKNASANIRCSSKCIRLMWSRKEKIEREIFVRSDWDTLENFYEYTRAHNFQNWYMNMDRKINRWLAMPRLVETHYVRVNVNTCKYFSILASIVATMVWRN